MSTTFASPPPPPRRRWLTRRKLLLAAGLGLVSLVVILILAGFLFVRSERFNRYLVGQVEQALLDYGLRAEIGALKIEWARRAVTLERVKLFNRQTNQLVASIDSLSLDAEIRNPYALSLRREIELEELGLSGLDLYFDVDEQGASNLRGVSAPEREPGRITFDYANLLASLNKGTLHVNDRSRQIVATLNDLRGEARPAEDQTIRLQLASGAGSVSYENRETSIAGLELQALAGPAGATIENLKLDSALAQVTAKGEIKNFDAPQTALGVEAQVALAEASRIFLPDTPLSGSASFQGRVEGEAAKYTLTGNLVSDELTAQGARLGGVGVDEVTVAIEGEGINFASPRLRARSLIFNGTRVSGLAASGVKGEWNDGVLKASAGQATVSRAEMAQGYVSGIALRSIEGSLEDGNYEARGALTVDSGVIEEARFDRASGRLIAKNNEVALNDFRADLLGGSASGDLALQIAGSGASRIETKFEGMQTPELFALVGDRPIPVTGAVSGEARLSWPGMNVRRLSGDVRADFSGATTETPDAIPVTGAASLTAQNGDFSVDELTLSTNESTLTATGRFSIEGDSDLRFTLASKDGSELQTIASSLEAAREAIDKYQPQLAGEVKVEGRLSGPLQDPTIEGELTAASVGLREETLGSLAGKFIVSPGELRAEDALLTMPNGGTARFSYAVPRSDFATGGRLDATFERLEVNTLLAAAGQKVEERFVSGLLSGEARLTGLPGDPQGTANARLIEGTIAGQPAESAQAQLVFGGQVARLEGLAVELPQGQLTATGSLNLESNDFQVQGQAKEVDLNRLVASLGAESVQVTGTANATFQATGKTDVLEETNIELTAQGQNVLIGGREAGELRLTARTRETGRVSVELLTGIAGKPQTVTANIDLRRPEIPIEVQSDLTDFELGPVLLAFAPAAGELIEGRVTGTLRASGPLRDEAKNFSIEGLTGRLQITGLSLSIDDNQVNVATPVLIALDGPQIKVESTRLTGQGMDLALGGTIGLRESAEMNFSLNGTVNLSAFDLLGPDISTAGSLLVDARIAGSVSEPRLAGEILLRDAAIVTADLPVAIEQANGRVVLAGDQITLENLTASANDGTLTASGALKLDGMQPSEWKFDARASNVDFYYQGLQAVADGTFTFAGTPQGQALTGTVTIPQAEYLTNFDLGEIVASRGGGGFDFGGGIGSGDTSSSRFLPVRLDIRVNAQDAILIRNEQVNTVATALLTVTGTASAPNVSGRVSLEGGTIEFRNERYEIVTGTLDLPSGAGATPYLNLLAEGDVSGYQVNVGFQGPLDDLEVTLRSEPQLARQEILSLITTGRVESGTIGSEEIVRSGLGTAASLLSEEFISRPVGREAEQLFGLSRFQIDPVLRPNANPAARLTIGRQLARNFSFLYSTNLAAEQDQTVLGEYNLTNRFSAIASFTQAGGGRLDQEGNDFTIELRGRKRFSLGLLDPVATGGTGPARPAPAPRPTAEVTVNQPEGIEISNGRLRELLPIMREGFSRALARLGERNLTNYLQEKGYFFAEVDSRCEPADCSGSNPRVIYDITPGQRYDLEEIRIEGTNVISKGDVSGDLQSQEDSFLGGVPFFENLPFIGGYARGLTSNDRLRRDREMIRRRLADLGFRSARVDSRLAVTPESENLIVIFAVEEGPRSTIADVALRGNYVLTSDELRQVMTVAEGQNFSLTEVRQGVQQINRAYGDRGYLSAATELSVIDLPDNRVRLVYSINEGPRTIIGEIAIEGATITEQEAIRRFLAFAPGEELTPTKIRLTQRDLYGTGAFREVNINTEPLGGSDESLHRVKVSVTETKPLLLIYGLGYSTDEGPRGLIELSHNNLFGRINTGTMRLRASRREQLAQLQYGNPRPFGRKWPLLFSVFYNRNGDLRTFIRRRMVNGEEQQDTAGRSFGLTRFATFVQTERKFGELTWIRFRYNFENVNLFNLENIPLVELTRNERAIRLGMFSMGISHDTRDSILNPTRGQLMSADYSLASRILGGNESFNKFFGNYQHYYTIDPETPFLGNTVLAFAARLGLAAAFRVTDRDGDGVITEPEERLPISERFFAGGSTTLRGFRFEEAGPQGILEPRNETELPTLVPLGGDALAIFNFELRYPLTERLRLVPFYDLGNVFRRTRDLSFSGMTNTIGLGLRFNTPIGPVGVDYGYMLDPPAFVTASGGVIRQPRGVIHIRFGQTF